MSENETIRPQQHNNTNNNHLRKSPVITNERMTDSMDPNTRNCIIAVPRYHENLFSQLAKYKDWLEEGTLGDQKIGRHYNRKVKTPEDLEVLNQLIQDLRTVKSELFIDFTFHRKPGSFPMREYMNEFLRVKGVYNYYTFISWYRVTCYTESGHPECQELVEEKDKETGEVISSYYPRKEYLIIPLFIRLKKNKVYEQFKSIHYLNASGTEYGVKAVNPKHFLKDDGINSKDQEDKQKKYNKYENDFVSKKLPDD